jgi:hypothetical protein
MDYELWLRFSAVGRLEYVQKTLAQTRLHADAKSVALFSRFGAELIEVIENYYAGPDLPEILKGTRTEALNKANLRAGHAAFWAGEYEVASGHLKQADWRFLTPRQKITRVGLWGLGLLSRLGFPMEALLRRVKPNPYTMRQEQGRTHD